MEIPTRVSNASQFDLSKFTAIEEDGFKYYPLIDDDKVLLFPNALTDEECDAAIKFMEDTNAWYENASEYSEEYGAARDDCHIQFPSQRHADIVSRTMNIWAKRYGKEFREKRLYKGYDQSDVEWNGVRYREGGAAWDHVDQPTEDDIGLLNLCIYLNDNYDGGELGFPHVDIPDYKPKKGDILWFPGHVWHYAFPVFNGPKYLVLLKAWLKMPEISDRC